MKQESDCIARESKPRVCSELKSDRNKTRAQIWKATILLGFGRKWMREKKKCKRTYELLTQLMTGIWWVLKMEHLLVLLCVVLWVYSVISCSGFLFLIFIFGVGLDFGLLFSHVAFFEKEGWWWYKLERGMSFMTKTKFYQTLCFYFIFFVMKIQLWFLWRWILKMNFIYNSLLYI